MRGHTMACQNSQWHFWKLREDAQRRSLFVVVGCLLSVALALEAVYQLLPPQRAPHLVVELLHAEGPVPAVLTVDAGEESRYTVPKTPQKDWKRPPCNRDMAEYAINGACWVKTAHTPPCARLYEYDGACYIPVARPPQRPAAIEE